MEVRKQVNEADASQSFEVRKLTVAENAILTAKILGVVGLIGAVLWAISLWHATK